MSPKKYTFSHEVDAAATKEEIAVGELRHRLEGDFKNLPDDKSLIKWLQARNFDIPKAEAMYRTSMAYREKMRVDYLKEEFTPPEIVKKYFPGGNIGYDKQGRPIRVELHGKLDLRGMVYSARQIDIERYKLTLWEELARQCREQGVDGSTVIADMSSLGTGHLWKPGVQMYTKILKILEDNYPEMMKRMFIINAPRLFIVLFKLVRPLLTEATKQKMQVLGSDYAKTLLQHIDADILPACYGGNKTDPDGDPRCPSMIGQGGKIPEDLYLKDSINTENMKTANVSRGDKLCLDFNIKIKGSILRWEFMTDGYDIGFGVFREDGGEKIPVIETERVKSHLIPEFGNLPCDQVGKYILVFDNSFSWARGKSVHYNVEVVDPEGHDETTSDITKMLNDGVTLDDVLEEKSQSNHKQS